MKHQPQSSPMRPRASRLLAVPLSLVTLFGGGSLWLLEMAIAPPAAQAYTARVNLSLDRRANESYDTLLRRAETAARAAAQRAFDNDILATEVSVIVAGQNSGLIVPILALEVSRADWRRRPDPQQWATYYSNADLLLGINQPVIAAPAPAPVPVPVPAPTAPVPSAAPGAAPAQTETAPAAGEGQAAPGAVPPATTTPGAAPPAQVQPGEAPAPGTAAPGTAAPGTAPTPGAAPGTAPAPTNAAPAPTNAVPTPPPGAAPAPTNAAPTPATAVPAPQQQTAPAPAPAAPAPTTTAPQPRSAVVCSGGTCRTVEQR